MQGRRPVAVAGANGKTTTTSMLTVALQGCGLDPSFAVGGELAKHGTNAHDGSDDVFVVEADESDGSFVVYRPEVAIVTNVQADHLDFYSNFTVVQAAYDAFVGTIRPGGLLVTCADDAGAVALAERARAAGTRVVTYGFDPASDVVLGDHQQDGVTSSVTLLDEGTGRRMTLGVPGRHNALNAAAAYAAAVHGLGQDPDRVLSGLASFTGTRRRFEPKGEAGGVVVVDDYAHNAGKVAAVVETAKSLVGDTGRLLVVFQPHLYSRTRDFAAELGAGLSPADVVVLMDVYAAREDPVPGVSGRLVADAVTAARPEVEVHYVPSWSEVAGRVAGLARPGDLVLTVGAGDVTMIGPEVLRILGGAAP
jgi:UDP-N-acetylmuramate--alanine ligase